VIEHWIRLTNVFPVSRWCRKHTAIVTCATDSLIERYSAAACRKDLTRSSHDD
jgi:hypothetical protein